MKGSDVAQVVPPAAYVATVLYGLSLQDWASALAVILLTLQICYFAWDKIIKPWRFRRRIRKQDAARNHTRKVVTKMAAKAARGD